MDTYKITFKNIGHNVDQLNAGVTLAIEDQLNAEKHTNLPHNAFIITNQDTISTLFIYLDDFSDADSPFAVLFPTQTIAVGVDDGVSFTTMWLKNTHATNNIAAKSIKYNIQTIKKV